MRSSYQKEDVILLLKDISGMIEPMENRDRERMIQSGVHYSEMLPKEHLPSKAYKQTFLKALERYAAPTAKAIELLSDSILAEKRHGTVLVSLARAGTPVGVLLKRYIRKRYGIEIPHYTISIIRGRGIDRNAMDYILRRHSQETIQFVDGWTGKGAIRQQLKEAMTDYPGVDDTIAVLSDPAYVSGKCGTHRDFLIPSSCLNATVSGLISRTFFRKDIIGEADFHGAAYYQEFEQEDLTEVFLTAVENCFGCDYHFDDCPVSNQKPQEEIQAIAKAYDISDINLIKPGLGEATRVLLRRIPWKILVHSLYDEEYLGHIYQLAHEKQIELEVYPFRYYKACGLIRRLADT